MRMACDTGGTFTDLPDIDLSSDTGVNASFTPVFEVIRDPLETQIASPADIVRVYDLIGLNTTKIKFVKKFIDVKKYINTGLRKFASEVRSKKYPTKKHSY